MPVVKTKSLLAKLGKKIDEAVRNHSKDEVDYGRDFSQIPAGITGGVAHLRICKFDVYKKGKNEGEPYFMAQAVCVEPESIVQTVNGQQVVKKVKGMQTKVGPIQVCDRKDDKGAVTKTLDEFVSQINQEIRKLGFEGELDCGSDMESAADDLQVASTGDTPIYFKFSTSVRQGRTKDEPDGVWENWNGVIPDYVPMDETSSQQVDNTKAESNGKPPTKTTVATGAEPDEPDIDEMISQAEGGDEEVLGKLAGMAKENGWTEDQIDAASYEQLKEMVTTKAEEKEETKDEDEDDIYGPDKVWGYKVSDPKNPKKKKEVDCVIKAHHKAKGMVDLLNLVDNKTWYKGIKYADLIGS